MVLLFTLTSMLTAALLFLVQPMVARMVLPAFGGSPQVWTTAMLFFQMALLAGYGYTHLATTRLTRRTQPWIHLAVVVLPLLLLPIALTVAPSGRGGLAPSFELLVALTIGVAGPFVVMATSGPLVQRWFSWTDHPRALDPYFLYAAGNIGSIGGLLAYPFFVEPYLDIEAQSRLWTAGYILAALLLGACALTVRRRSIGLDTAEHSGPESGSPVPTRRIARWLLLAFIPSSLMLAVTAHISADVAAVPMLWVVPLATYLLTFTVAFSRFGPAALRGATVLAPAVVVAAITLWPRTIGMPAAVVLQVLLVAVGGLIAHGQLAQDRPHPSQLTRFYVVIAAGGALGGIFNGLIAPRLFPTVIEYGLITALTLGLVIRWRDAVAGLSDWPLFARLAVAMLLFAIPPALLALSALNALPDNTPLLILSVAAILFPLLTVPGKSGVVGLAVAVVAVLPQVAALAGAETVERTFFGVHRVTRDESILKLAHGTTVHGTQDISSTESRRRAISYYHPQEPFGDVMRMAGDSPVVGVLGLGAGGIAAYGRVGQTLVFHEIDPAIVRIAEQQFTYLTDTPAQVEIILGDGRLTLAGIRDRYGLLVMDAFTSDAIPVHLLTLEAMQVYLDAIERDGVIAINITNRHMDLRPVLRGAAEALGVTALERKGQGVSEGALPSHWIVLARAQETLAPLREIGWTELTIEPRVWTDQRSSLWSVLIRQTEK